MVCLHSKKKGKKSCYSLVARRLQKKDGIQLPTKMNPARNIVLPASATDRLPDQARPPLSGSHICTANAKMQKTIFVERSKCKVTVAIFLKGLVYL